MTVIRKYCSENDRNDIILLGDGSAVWQRDPDADGKGVAERNQRPDFIRVVAYAVFNFKVSTVVNPARRAWRWNYRQSVEPLVRVLSHGWNATPQETIAELGPVLKLAVEVDARGNVTGSVVN